VTEGAEVKAGLVSSFLATDPVKGAATYDDALVLITREKIDTVSEIVPLLSQVIDVKKPLLIVARDIAPEIVSLLVVNRQNGSLKVAAVKPAASGEKLNVLLEDLALLTGTEVVTKEKGQALALLSSQRLGQVKQFTSTATTTLFHASLSVPTEAKDKLTTRLREDLQRAADPNEQASLTERLRILSGNLVTLFIGAATETELKAKMQLADNAVKAVRAALEEGVVPGGGIAFLDLSRRLLPQSFGFESAGKRRGAKIFLEALLAPLKALAENANLEPLPLLSRLMEAEPGSGCDFSSSRTIKMQAAGIQDPTKVVRVALENAVSVVSDLINTSVAVLEENE
jgi:chaperonin GroEL